MAAREAPASTLLERGRPDYPRALLDLADPPARLHVRGLLPVGRAVAIVGARAATPYGLGLARRIAADLARLGIAIVSGLARGIDAASHVGALEAGGRTVAVLPGGLDRITPPGHELLAARVRDAGALVGEWPDGVPPTRGLFLRRNRLIAALGAATVVVEAGERSGALSTARVARSIGRECLAVPGDVDRPTSRGCHLLLREGARLCEDASDVLAALDRPLARPAADRLAPRAPGGPREDPEQGDGPRPRGSAGRRLLDALGDEPAGLESLAAAAHLGVGEALAELLSLQWGGLAVARPGQRWTRSRRELP